MRSGLELREARALDDGDEVDAVVMAVVGGREGRRSLVVEGEDALPFRSAAAAIELSDLSLSIRGLLFVDELRLDWLE